MGGLARGITHGGVLRQASFKGIREDKSASEVVREVPARAGPPEVADIAAAPEPSSATRAAAARTSSGAGGKKSAPVPATKKEGARTADGKIGTGLDALLQAQAIEEMDERVDRKAEHDQKRHHRGELEAATDGPDEGT